jgi:hypothetical protein
MGVVACLVGFFLHLGQLFVAPVDAGVKTLDQAAEPRLQDETVAWEWTGQTVTVRLAIYYLTTDAPTGKDTGSAEIFEWRMDGDKVEETTRRLLGEDPFDAGNKSAEDAELSDKRKTGQGMGLHGYFFGSGIRFQVVATNAVLVSRRALRDGTEEEYRGIISRYRRKDAINVYIAPTRILDSRGRMAGLAIRVPAYAALVFEPHPRRLAHEVGHLLGLGHADRGVMWSVHPPVQRLDEPRVKNGAFTPSQVRRMQSAMGRFRELVVGKIEVDS